MENDGNISISIIMYMLCSDYCNSYKQPFHLSTHTSSDHAEETVTFDSRRDVKSC